MSRGYHEQQAEQLKRNNKNDICAQRGFIKMGARAPRRRGVVYHYENIYSEQAHGQACNSMRNGNSTNACSCQASAGQLSVRISGD